MKRILFLLALTASLGATAQTLNPIGRSSEMGALRSQRSTLLTTANGDYLMAGAIPRIATMVGRPYANKGIGLQRYDSHFALQQEASLKQWKDYEYKAAHLRGDTVALLMLRQEKKSSTLCRADLGAATLAPMADPQPLMAMPVDKKGENLWWTATSPNGQHTAVVGLALDAKGNVMRAHMVMLDASFRPRWERRLDLDLLSQLEVRDDGVAFLFGSSNSQGGIYLSMVALLENDAESYQGHIDIPGMDKANGQEARLVREDDGRLLVVGDIVTRDKNAATIGTFALAFDYLAGKPIGSDVHMINKDEYETIHFFRQNKDRRLLAANENATPAMIAKGLEGVGVSHVARTPYGGAVAVQGGHTVRYTDRQGTTTFYIYRYGTCLYGVDTLGHFLWNSLVPTHSVVTDYACEAQCFLLSRGDEVLFIQNEQYKHNKVGDPENFTMFPIFSSCYHALYRLDRQGRQQRVSLSPSEADEALQEHYTTPDGHHLFYAARMRKGLLYELQF